MNRLFLSISIAFLGCMTSCSQPSQRQHNPDCPIKEETIKIGYSHHTNSGMARYTSVQIYPDSLVWSYSEARNGCSLGDISRYDRKAFDELIQTLSAISFAAKDAHNYPLGGSGFAYAFEDKDGCYLSFQRGDDMSGDYMEVYGAIQGFVNSHKTDCQKLFEKLSRMPHEKAMFGEFKELPEQLKKYKR